TDVISGATGSDFISLGLADEEEEESEDEEEQALIDAAAAAAAWISGLINIVFILCGVIRVADQNRALRLRCPRPRCLYQVRHLKWLIASFSGMQTRVEDTPQEVLVRMLHNCDYVTITRVSLTCKKAYQAVSSSVSLQLHIELEINGLEIADGSSKGNPNYSLILKELRDYQDNWLDLKLSPLVSQRIRTTNADMPNWDLRSGTYYGEFCASELDHDQDYLVDRTQLATLGSSSLSPSTNYGKKFSFCIVDPKQDLAALVEDERVDSGLARLHLHSVTTGQPHPLAEHPILTIGIDGAFLHEHNLLGEPMSTDPKVMGRYLAVKFNWPESDYNVTEILLWDWRTGVLLARVYCEHHSARYTYIDKEHLLVYSALAENNARSAHLALLIYHIPNLTSGYAAPPNANFCPTLYPKHNPILIFEFPDLHHQWEITSMDFMLSADPLPGDVVYAKSATLLCSHVTTLGLGFQIQNNPRQQSHIYRSSQGSPIVSEL
ncbi:unnamed protein product, partial [Rhizoctonia solani]